MNAVYMGNNRVLTYLWNMNIGFIVPTDNIMTLNTIAGQGIYEGELTRFMFANIKEGMVCVDIGANIGYHSLLMGYLVNPHKGRVYCFEANPYLIPTIKDNLDMHYYKHCKVFNNAVFSENKEIEFNISKKFNENSSVFIRQNYTDEIEKIKIQAITLDSLYDELGVVGFVKMDIEGSEYDAFLGAERLISDGKIRNIVFEYNAGMLGDKQPKFIELLRSYKRPIYGISFSGDKEPLSFEQLIKEQFRQHVLIEF